MLDSEPCLSIINIHGEPTTSQELSVEELNMIASGQRGPSGGEDLVLPWRVPQTSGGDIHTELSGQAGNRAPGAWWRVPGEPVHLGESARAPYGRIEGVESRPQTSGELDWPRGGQRSGFRQKEHTGSGLEVGVWGGVSGGYEGAD